MCETCIFSKFSWSLLNPSIYNAILALSMINANDKCVGVNHGTFEGTVSNLLGTTQKVTNSSPNVTEIANERV